MRFPFIDLQAQRAVIADDIEAAIKRVMEHGQFILGPEVAVSYTHLTLPTIYSV